MTMDVEFHLQRARCERDIAYRCSDARASDAHMQLSALHLQQALSLQEQGQPANTGTPRWPGVETSQRLNAAPVRTA